MAQPQRGQEEQLPPHTVPQEEQVLQPQQPAAVAVEPFPFETPRAAGDCCGNRGSEKNSSQTFSANSSAGGISQKP